MIGCGIHRRGSAPLPRLGGVLVCLLLERGREGVVLSSGVLSGLLQGLQVHRQHVIFVHHILCREEIERMVSSSNNAAKTTGHRSCPEPTSHVTCLSPPPSPSLPPSLSHLKRCHLWLYIHTASHGWLGLGRLLQYIPCRHVRNRLETG